jgi:hypothetical protein
MRTKTAVALGSVACSMGCVLGGVAELFNYTPGEDPGALSIGMHLVGTGIILLLFPAALVLIWVASEFRREMRRSGLSPTQVAVIETAALTAAHYAWRDHNVKESARLTESVMGPERSQRQWPES